jgi:hypothetical protein
MKRIPAGIPYLEVFLLIAAIILSGCGGQELASTWCDREVTVDGLDTEWNGAMTYVADENVALGLLNDDEYLYLCLATVDSRMVWQVVGSGLTVWFDAEGGKKKPFGINFPLGADFSPGGGDKGDKPMPGSGEHGPDPEKLREMLEVSSVEMAILGPGENERRLMPVVGSQELRAKLGYAGGKLVYELRVPLVRDMSHPDAIGLEDGDNIGLGFETTEIDMGAMKERMKKRMGEGGPPMGSGMGGGGMRGGGMRGGGKRGGQGPDGDMPERLELWIKVQLAGEENELSL